MNTTTTEPTALSDIGTGPKVKVKVFANHRPIGWLRLLAGEAVIRPSLAKGTTFGSDVVGFSMAQLVGPEAATAKAPTPVVTFQICKV